jgi:hypothetical protein
MAPTAPPTTTLSRLVAGFTLGGLALIARRRFVRFLCVARFDRLGRTVGILFDVHNRLGRFLDGFIRFGAIIDVVGTLFILWLVAIRTVAASATPAASSAAAPAPAALTPAAVLIILDSLRRIPHRLDCILDVDDVVGFL